MDVLHGYLSHLAKLLEELCTESKESDSQWKLTSEIQAQFIGRLGTIQSLRGLLAQKQATLKTADSGNDSKQNMLQEISKALDSANKQAGKIYEKLLDSRKALLSSLKRSVELVIAARCLLVDDALQEWKRRQKMAQIGLLFEREEELLDQIAERFEYIAEEVWTLLTVAQWFSELLEQSPKLPDQNVPQCLAMSQQILSALTDELRAIVHSSFIVSKQPNVVLKQHNKFNAEARLLIGDKLGIKFFNVKVSVKLVGEEQARSLEEGVVSLPDAPTVAKIGISSLSESEKDSQEVNLEVERESKRVKAVFKSKLLKVDPRKSVCKNADDQQVPVCERNYALLFTCSPFKMGGVLFDNVWALSLPVKLTVHGSQERLSHAMILWNHAFSPAKTPFNIPDAVEWNQLAEALRYKFKYQTGATRPLSKSDLDYLAEKVLGQPLSSAMQPAMVTIDMFCKNPMRQDLDFSFWSWFFEITVLVKQKLLRLWDEGLIRGFISRQEAREVLLSLQESCFLLRFSDSHLGGLSVSFATFLEDGRREVFPLAPFTAKDLEHLSLGPRIARCPQLLHIEHVYGSERCFEKSVIFRQEAEMRHKSQAVNPKTYPYITSELIMVAHTAVPGISEAEASPSSPSNGICPSPGDDLSTICECVGITSDFLDNPINLNDFDWNSLGVGFVAPEMFDTPMADSDLFSCLEDQNNVNLDDTGQRQSDSAVCLQSYRINKSKMIPCDNFNGVWMYPQLSSTLCLRKWNNVWVCPLLLDTFSVISEQISDMDTTQSVIGRGFAFIAFSSLCIVGVPRMN
uniref:Signal transducer and activator of transcription n=1 Tax=Trichuris muris TaxID=70415 RepID=A0A5S6QMM1_TRIMR